MARVDSWFAAFVGRLVERLPRYDWPAPGSEFWDAVRSRMVHHGVREAEADAASLLLMDAPPAHPDKVWPELLAAVLALRESRAPAAPAPAAPAAPRDYSAWDRAAAGHWAALSEPDRESWRSLVRERLPELAGRPGWLEGLARGWAYDPSLVAGPPPPPRDAAWKRPRGPRVPAAPPAPDVADLPPGPAPPAAAAPPPPPF